MADAGQQRQDLGGLNKALWAKAAEDKLLRIARVRADTTVIPANVAYPTDAGLWPRRSASWCARRGGSRLRKRVTRRASRAPRAVTADRGYGQAAV